MSIGDHRYESIEHLLVANRPVPASSPRPSRYHGMLPLLAVFGMNDLSLSFATGVRWYLSRSRFHYELLPAINPMHKVNIDHAYNASTSSRPQPSRRRHG